MCDFLINEWHGMEGIKLDITSFYTISDFGEFLWAQRESVTSNKNVEEEKKACGKLGISSCPLFKATSDCLLWNLFF